MCFRASALCISLIFAFLATTAAQEVQPKPAAQPQAPAAAPKSPTNKKLSAAAKAKADEQKALALSLLVSLATDARSFPDQTLRARTLARIADALWEPDPDQGRTLFRRAWDAATVADQERLRKMEEERKKQEAATGSFAIARGPDLRAEVLRLAAKRDRALGEEMLEKMTEAKKQEAIEATSSARRELLNTPAAQRQRLQLAGQLLEADAERALQFADPALTNVTMDGLNFLSLLREKNSEAADMRYARLLTIAQNDLQTDANTVSLLSSYLFTPHMFIMFEPGGGQNTSQMRGRTPPPDVAPELRTAFMQTAARILLRPSASKELDNTSAGMQGKYLVIRRLLPLFEQYAAKEMVDQLKAEMSVLAQGSNRTFQDEDDEGLRRGLVPERSSEDMEQSLLDRLDRAKTAEERDGLYVLLALRTAEKGEMRARDFVDKVDNMDVRKQVKPYVDMTLAMHAVEKKDFDKALMLAEVGELTHIQRVWVLTQAAKQMPPADKEKALETIETAATEARRIGGSEPDRTRALVAVANAYLTVDKSRAWEMMLEIAKASKSVEGFSGEDGRLIMRMQTKAQTSLRTNTVEDFNLTGVFRALAQDNADQAVELARSFEREAPRSTALIAVARTLLGDKGR
ncbi:MAG TPA: hypothetical protein VJU84_08935 [Pyrinomonadaceae bacterium]|nr:hypothetical protein [Pyrinomonadaceae bacterium]